MRPAARRIDLGLDTSNNAFESIESLGTRLQEAESAIV